jgi:outer membrane beta-barrel protein
MKRTRSSAHPAFKLLLLITVITASETAAYALQGGEDPALLPVLIDKRYGPGGRLQLSAQFATNMVTKFVESTGAYLAVDYNFNDIFGVEVGGGFYYGAETSIMDEVRANFPSMEPPLSDLYQLIWMANVDAVLVPIYGKISFAAEYDPSFDVFILAGAGFAGLKKKTGSESNPLPQSSISSGAPIFNAGFGFRFYFTRLIAIRLEIREYLFPQPKDQYSPDASGLTGNLMAQAGFQFTFGGED